MANGSTPAAIAATNQNLELARALSLAHAAIKNVENLVGTVALALRHQGCDLDYRFASVLENATYEEINRTQRAIEDAQRIAGVDTENED